MIYDRDFWRAQHGQGHRMVGPDPCALVVIHHAAVPDIPCGVGRDRERAVLRAIEQHHVRTNGWAGIGYSFCVFQSGNVYVGRGWRRVGAHTRGRNSTAYGICIVIDGVVTDPSAAAIEGCRDIITAGIRLGHIDPDYRIGWHALYAQTACPGARVIERLGKLGPLVEPAA
jgi:N-acetylmuramoyl-L-alanine amidase